MATLHLRQAVSLVFVGLCFFIFSENSRAANWYVDNAVSNAGSGQSWATAWKNFSDITWGASGVKAGDTLYISGGSTSKTYNETLVIGASGTAGNLITVSTGQESEHYGTVIIDGQTIRDCAVNLSGKSYVKLTGQVGHTIKMKLTMGNFAGLSMAGPVTNTEIAYLEVASNGTVADTHGIVANLPFHPNRNLEIHHCFVHDNYQDGMSLLQSTAGEATQYGTVKIYHNTISHINDDGIETSFSCDIYDNEFGPRLSSGGRGHPDQIQFYNSYVRIYNNYFHGSVITADPGNSNSNIFCDPFDPDITLNPKNIQIYNNLIVENATPGSGDYHRGIALKFAEPGILSANHILVANNTIMGIPFFALSLTLASLGTDSVSNIIIENNIFKDIGATGSVAVAYSNGNGSVTFGSHGDGTDVVVDYNVTFASSGAYKTDIDWEDKIITLAAFKSSTGCEVHGLVSDPLLDVTQKLTELSPAKNSGVSLASFFTTDRLGVSRPQGVAWDIGAYEYADPLSPGDGAAGWSVTAYPNPARDRVYFRFAVERPVSVEVQIYNLAGEPVSKVSGRVAPDTPVLEWDAHGFAPGGYVFTITGDERVKLAGKVFIVK